MTRTTSMQGYKKLLGSVKILELFWNFTCRPDLVLVKI